MKQERKKHKFSGLLNKFGNKIDESEYSFGPLGTRADGRATYDSYYINPITTGFAYISPDTENDWQLKSVDEESLSYQTAQELIDILINSSPDLDRALHDMYQFSNTGWQLTCDDPVGQRILDNARTQMADLGQDLDSKVDQLIASGFLWGALFSESVFDLNGRDFIDLAIVSPAQARFQRQDHPIRGQYWQLGQEEKGRFVPLMDPTIIYKSLNPVPDKPFGRPMVNSALFGIIFQLGLLKSARQVINTQAWPRQIWKIDRTVLKDANVSPKQIDKIVQETEEKIERYMSNSNLEKAKQPVTGSEVLNETIGGVNRANFGMLESIQRTLDTWITRGLKQYPILFGINSNSGLSDNSDIQLEAHSIFINSFQNGIGEHLSRQFQHVLNAAGYPHLKAVFKLEQSNTLVRKHRAESLERETNALSKAIQNRIMTRQEARIQLKSFSTSFNNLDSELSSTVNIDEITSLISSGVISPEEGRQLLKENLAEFANLA